MGENDGEIGATHGYVYEESYQAVLEDISTVGVPCIIVLIAAENVRLSRSS
jgi:hypothetical protein